MIHVLEHPRVEVLFAALAEELRQRPQGPLREEVVVVESLGMARRLPLELATRLGSVVRLSVPFPARYLWDLLLRPGLASDALAPWECGALAWLLADLLAEDGGAGVAAHLLAQDRDGRLRHDLARRLADLFDQYLVHRPGLLLEWEGRRDCGLAGAGLTLPETPQLAWQRGLWRRLCERIGRPHRAALLAAALARLEAGELPQNLPARLSLFGLSGLPPDLLRAFSLLSRHLPVRLFLQNPSFDYWGDLPSRLRVPEDELLRSQAPLLAANGLERGRWIDQLLDEGADFSNLPGPGVEPRTTLELLQSSHLDLSPLPRPLANDHSLQLHACHTLGRQAEVLVDRLLDLFQRLPGLGPGDVLVLCPDLEAARPALEAALGAQEEGRALPWRLLELPAGGLATALGQVLQLLGGRWPSAAVLAPLSCPALRRRLGIEAGDLPAILRWCRDTGVRWGWDADSREALDLPATGEHGWRAGLDRLLLGYATAEEVEVAGLLPLPAAGLVEPARLQAWLGWLRLLRRLEAAAAAPRPPGAWAAWLREELPRLFAPDKDEERELQHLRETLSRLETEARHGSALAVALPVARDAILPRLSETGGIRGGGFDGRLTVAPMLAGRLLPARVVVLLGLEDQAFPRPGGRDELDLCLAHPLTGDHNPREQDRAQFLDALHAAQDALLIFWNGRDARENTRKPPSVVVSELLAVLGRPEPDQPHPAVVEHALQGFSPLNYLGPVETRSFHAAHGRAALRLQRARRPGHRPSTPGPAFLEALPLPAPSLELSLDELVRFYANPAQAFLKRAGVSLPWEAQELEESEPFASNPLDLGLLRREALEGLRSGAGPDEVERRLRAAGRLPWGRAGRAELEGALALATPLLEAERLFREAGPATWIDVDLSLGGLRLRGRLEAVGDQRLELTTRSAGTIVLMETWLRHLAWCCHEDGAPACVTRLVCRDDTWTFRRPPDARARLETLLRRWHEGQSAWLPWLPVVSEAVADALGKEPGNVTALLAERDWYEGREYLRDNPWLQVALGEADPFTHPQLAPRVAELALELGLPLLEALA